MTSQAIPLTGSNLPNYYLEKTGVVMSINSTNLRDSMNSQKIDFTETTTNNLLDLIGHTPMVEVTNIDTGPCRLFLKLENQNPGGSIKDRIALSMIAAAEKEGKIANGGTLIEATAGNTGLALAMVAVRKGYKMLIVIPDKMSQEKIFHLRALGAEVVMTRSDVGKGHPEYYQDMAERLSKEIPNSFYINQFGNPANPQAHEEHTAPEIWHQMGGDVDAILCGVGSGGTMTGLSRFFSKVNAKTKLVLADPKGSILTDYINTGTFGTAGSWLVEGVGEDFIPPVCDLSRVKDAISVTDAESFAAARDLLKHEGIFGGSSTGTLIAAALKYCRSRTQPERVVTFVCDSGNKYLSKMYNDFWMADNGFIQREKTGDLRDLISRLYSAKAVVTLKPEDTLLMAYGRFKMYDVSQLPVVENDQIVGLIDESDVLLAVYGKEERFREPVSKFMTKQLQTVQPNVEISALLEIFDAGRVPIICEGSKFLGLITRIDLLNYLRRRMPN